MANELELVDKHLERINDVMVHYLEGSDPTSIAKKLGLTRVAVMDAIAEWRTLSANNKAIRDRAQDALAAADMHFSRLVAKAYEVMEEASANSNLNAKTNSIKLVLDIEAKRIEMLQKAGALSNKDLADTLAEIEQKYDTLKTLLSSVLCTACKLKVVQALQEPIVIDIEDLGEA